MTSKRLWCLTSPPLSAGLSRAPAKDISSHYVMYMCICANNKLIIRYWPNVTNLKKKKKRKKDILIVNSKLLGSIRSLKWFQFKFGKKRAMVTTLVLTHSLELRFWNLYQERRDWIRASRPPSWQRRNVVELGPLGHCRLLTSCKSRLSCTSSTGSWWRMALW